MAIYNARRKKAVVVYHHRPSSFACSGLEISVEQTIKGGGSRTVVGLAGKQFITYCYNMNLADVELFRTIAALGSLSAAARHLGTTPMLVSRRLAALEGQIGARLFHRTTRSLSLTTEGEAFVPHAAALIETRDAA